MTPTPAATPSAPPVTPSQPAPPTPAPPAGQGGDGSGTGQDGGPVVGGPTGAPADAGASPSPTPGGDALTPSSRSPEPVAFGTWVQPSSLPVSGGDRAPVAPVQAHPSQDLVGAVLGLVSGQAERVVKPQAAAAVAATFGFPLALMLAVLLYILAQGWIDRRDPKLRAAPRTVRDTVLAFREEHEL